MKVHHISLQRGMSKFYSETNKNTNTQIICTRPDSSSRRTIAATQRRRTTPCSHMSTAQRGYLAAIATQLLRRYSATRCNVTAQPCRYAVTQHLNSNCGASPQLPSLHMPTGVRRGNFNHLCSGGRLIDAAWK